MRYLDPDVDSLPAGPANEAPNTFVSVMWKRKAYEYEREVRALLAPAGFLRETFRPGCTARV